MRTPTGRTEVGPASLARRSARIEPFSTRVRPPRWRLIATDSLALFVASLIGVTAWGWVLGPAAPPRALRPAAWLIFIPVALVLMAVYGLYRRPSRRVRSLAFLDLAHLFHALTLSGLVTLALSGEQHRLFGVAKLTWSEVAACALPALVAVPALRAAATAVMDRNGIPRTRVVVAGGGTTASRLIARLRLFGDIDVLGWVDDPSLPGAATAPSEHYLGAVTELAALCATYGVDRVLVAFDEWNERPLAEWLRDTPATTQISVIAPSSDLVTCRSVVDEFHGLAVIDVTAPPAGPGQRFAKRAIDIVVSAAVLVALSPVLIIVGWRVKRDSPGPALFRQVRVGRHGEPFVMFKFRTMTAGAELQLPSENDMDGPTFKLRSDPRVTRVGRALRRYSVDEVPQLINVLQGRMSLVGPRPLPTAEWAAYQGWAARRQEVRPGMTGYWQVSGRNDLSFAELQQLDHAYAASWSLWWDLKILWQTPGAVLRRRGAY